MKDYNLDAYYYSFDLTLCSPVDSILDKVASAGSGYHHTEDWNNKDNGKQSPVESIQKAAEKASSQFIAMRHAMQTFVDRVDRGEVRSKKTYAHFKEILALID